MIAVTPIRATPPIWQRLLAGSAIALLLSSCLLPSFEAVDNGSYAQPIEARTVCELPTMLASSCQSCIQAQCCEAASSCAGDDTCRGDVNKPITPVADFSAAFDPLLTCMAQKCDSACDVSWGCVGKYEIPPADENPYTTSVNFVDFAAETISVDDVSVKACFGLSSDTGCRATVDNADGETTLSLPASFDGQFNFTGGERAGEPYLDATVQWSAPIYRHFPFTHFMLRDSNLRELALLSQYHDTKDQAFDPRRAHLIVRVQSCLPHRFLNRNPKEGLVAEAEDIIVSTNIEGDGAPRFFYTLESNQGPAPFLESTTRDGIAGAFEMPVGLVQVYARRADTDEVVAQTAISLSAGKLGFAYLLPNTSD